jgi:hypothetical protein
VIGLMFSLPFFYEKQSANFLIFPGYLDCIVDLYNCTATFASCRSVFKTCKQNLPELPLGRSGATVGGTTVAGNGGTAAIRPVAAGTTFGRGGLAAPREDGTPSLADGAGKVPESKLTAPSL